MKRVKLYDSYSTYFVLFVLAFLHLAVIGLSIFFVKHFIIDQHDTGILVLIFAFIGLMLYIDIGGHKYQLYGRYLTRCTFDKNGINCRCIGRRWTLPWNEIRTYGISGYNNKYKPIEYESYAIIFFSLVPDELFDQKVNLALNSKRIVFQERKKIWPLLSEYMPEDMKKTLQESIDKKRDCFGRRKAEVYFENQ